jgi:hypothetical protein
MKPFAKGRSFLRVPLGSWPRFAIKNLTVLSWFLWQEGVEPSAGDFVFSDGNAALVSAWEGV